jgi:hypothetical protein
MGWHDMTIPVATAGSANNRQGSVFSVDLWDDAGFSDKVSSFDGFLQWLH